MLPPRPRPPLPRKVVRLLEFSKLKLVSIPGALWAEPPNTRCLGRTRISLLSWDLERSSRKSQFPPACRPGSSRDSLSPPYAALETRTSRRAPGLHRRPSEALILPGLPNSPALDKYAGSRYRLSSCHSPCGDQFSRGYYNHLCLLDKLSSC